MASVKITVPVAVAASSMGKKLLQMRRKTATHARAEFEQIVSEMAAATP